MSAPANGTGTGRRYKPRYLRPFTGSFRVRQAKIGIHVTRAALHFDTVNEPFFHVVAPLQVPRPTAAQAIPPPENASFFLPPERQTQREQPTVHIRKFTLEANTRAASGL